MKLSIKGMFYAKECHRNTNHLYNGHPYEVHLKMVNDVGLRFQHLLPQKEMVIETVFAAIWAHDVIEDCRQTYNDVKLALGSEVADIVYALTNEKGKSRKERANDKYYTGINETPYANFVKLCDRIANFEYSLDTKSKMAEMYAKEMEQFSNRLWCSNLKEMFDYLGTLCNKAHHHTSNNQ